MRWLTTTSSLGMPSAIRSIFPLPKFPYPGEKGTRYRFSPAALSLGEQKLGIKEAKQRSLKQLTSHDSHTVTAGLPYGITHSSLPSKVNRIATHPRGVQALEHSGRACQCSNAQMAETGLLPAGMPRGAGALPEKSLSSCLYRPGPVRRVFRGAERGRFEAGEMASI